MIPSLLRKTTIWACGLASLLAPEARAQDARATIAGQVTDASGAAMPGVKIRAVNAATNISVSAVTNESGIFTVLYLAPGSYDVAASLAGFATMEKRGIELRVGDRVEVNFSMQLATIAERVEVAT